MPRKHMHLWWFMWNAHKILKTISTICVHCNKLSTQMVHWLLWEFQRYTRYFIV
jgi:hypothetical protein